MGIFGSGGGVITRLSDLLSTNNNTQLKTTLYGSDGTEVVVNSDGQMHVVMQSAVDDNNSSTTPLAAGATFTGVSTDISNYAGIAILVKADQTSATGGLQVMFSFDEITWFGGESYTIEANATKFFTPPKQGMYMRVTFENGGVEQTEFNLHTMLNKVPTKWSSHNLNDDLDDDDDGELVVSVPKLRTAQDTYVSAAATSNGNFKASLEELESGISVNSNSQLRTTSFHSDGTAGQLITGIDYASGKSGIDASTETLQQISYEHHEIHSGSHYNYCDYALNQASAATIEFVMTTPDTTTWNHLSFSVYSSEGATLELYEGTTGVTGGTTITPRNNNRNSSNTSVMTLVKDPASISSDGTRAAGFLAGGGRTAGLISRDKENVLKQNTAYLVRITSLAVSNDISWCAEWYEHADKN